MAVFQKWPVTAEEGEDEIAGNGREGGSTSTAFKTRTPNTVCLCQKTNHTTKPSSTTSLDLKRPTKVSDTSTHSSSSMDMYREATIGGATIACALAGPLIVTGGLAVAGFGTTGVAAGSLAAGIQSGIGNVVAGSLFATAQSVGAVGLAQGTAAAISGGFATLGGATTWLATSSTSSSPLNSNPAPKDRDRDPKDQGDDSDLKNSPETKGWLYKWTNYIKGYQKRWFVLANGLMSYYCNQAEMAHTCRGTISLHGAHIHTEDSCNFIGKEMRLLISRKKVKKSLKLDISMFFSSK